MHHRLQRKGTYWCPATPVVRHARMQGVVTFTLRQRNVARMSEAVPAGAPLLFPLAALLEEECLQWSVPCTQHASLLL